MKNIQQHNKNKLKLYSNHQPSLHFVSYVGHYYNVIYSPCVANRKWRGVKLWTNYSVQPVVYLRSLSRNTYFPSSNSCEAFATSLAVIPTTSLVNFVINYALNYWSKITCMRVCMFVCVCVSLCSVCRCGYYSLSSKQNT